jgi:hypothetical protein
MRKWNNIGYNDYFYDTESLYIYQSFATRHENIIHTRKTQSYVGHKIKTQG